jgi:hypothetical protein
MRHIVPPLVLLFPLFAGCGPQTPPTTPPTEPNPNKPISIGLLKPGEPTKPTEAGKPAEPPKAPDPAKPAEPDKPKAPDPKETAKNNLKQIGIAMHNFEAAMGFLPAGSYAKGGVGLSWRVQILPYLEQENLFRQFKMDEPWDSETNKKLIEKMPAVYASPGKPADKGMTHLRAFTGPGAFIPTPAPTGLQPGWPVRGRSIVGITDGSSNTLLVAESAEPVIWTKPDELPFDGKAVPKLGGAFAGGFHGLMGDAQVYWFGEKVSEDTLRAAITVNGGEVVDLTPVKFPQGAPTPKKPPTEMAAGRFFAAERKVAMQRLQTLHAAAMKFHDANGHLPAGVITSKEAVGLSWRVQLLPYLGEETLYKDFKLTEPWDSEHNKKLLERMPAVYQSPRGGTAAGYTYLSTTRGPQGVVYAPVLQTGQKPPPFTREPGQPAPGRKLTDLQDGAAITILYTETTFPVAWTKPDDVDVVPAPAAEQPKGGGIVKVVIPKQLKKYEHGQSFLFDGGFHAVLADGTVAFYKYTLSELELGFLLTVAGGEPVDPLPFDHVEYYTPSKK